MSYFSYGIEVLSLYVLYKRYFEHVLIGQFLYYNGKLFKTRLAGGPVSPLTGDYSISAASPDNYQRLHDAVSLKRSRELFELLVIEPLPRLVLVAVNQRYIYLLYALRFLNRYVVYL